MYRVAILAYDGLATFELGCAIELFALPRPEIDDWYSCEVVSFDEGPLSATGGITIQARPIQDLERYNMLIVPSWPIDADPVSLALAASITKFVLDRKRILSFCSGAFLLGELGLLNGRKATTHWRYAEEFKSRFPQTEYVDDVLYVYDGKIGCSAGSAAAIDLGMEVIRSDFDFETANAVARRLVMPPQRAGGQSQFVETPIGRRPSAFAESLDWAIKHLNENVSVNDLASQANMSRRTFDRHFRKALDLSPLEWLANQRIQLAQQLLETTQESIEVIAIKVGFNNALTLRHNFKKHLGISPGDYRKQFRAS